MVHYRVSAFNWNFHPNKILELKRNMKCNKSCVETIRRCSLQAYDFLLHYFAHHFEQAFTGILVHKSLLRPHESA